MYDSMIVSQVFRNIVLSNLETCEEGRETRKEAVDARQLEILEAASSQDMQG
jgi:hypothetical protein